MKLPWPPWGPPRLERRFPARARRRIAEAVRAAEASTSGEIRVKILDRCDPDLRDRGAPEERLRAQALREFRREGVHATRNRTGVLLLLVMEDRRLRILADRGIHPLLPPAWWDGLAGRLADRLRGAEAVEGVCEAVAAIGAELAARFPPRPDDRDELPDAPALGRSP